MNKPSHWVVCAKCTKKDQTDGMHVGTKTVMRCDDCAGADGKATMCRSCCPTGHGTRWSPEANEEWSEE